MHSLEDIKLAIIGLGYVGLPLSWNSASIAPQ